MKEVGEEMTTAEKIALLEDSLNLDEGTLREDTKLADLDKWDSIAKLTVIVLMDDEFDKIIKADDIERYVTVADILEDMA